MEALKRQNILDFRIFKKNNLNFFSKVRHPIYTKDIKYKTKRIPISFLEVFDQKSYLYANVDVKKSIEKKQFHSALEHFILYGYDEVKNAKRRIGNEFPFMTEEEYLNVNPDLKTAFSEGKIDSVFGHFMTYGYKEFQNKSRELSGHYPFELTKEIQDFLFDKFNQNEYLAVNPDLSSIKVGELWKYFLQYGIDEIRKGERIFNQDLPFLSEYTYVMSNTDIFEGLKNGSIPSPAEHFFLYGMWEILNGTRKIKGENTYRYYEPVFNEEVQLNISRFKNTPLLSIIMTIDDATFEYMKTAIESLQKQWYGYWELHIVHHQGLDVIVDEYLKTLNHKQVKIHLMDTDVNVSHTLNRVLPTFNGDYVLFLSAVDLLTVDALYEVVKVIKSNDAEFIYSDEDRIGLDGRFINPNFKPDLSMEMLMSVNYFGHLTAVKKSLIQKVGAWNETLDSCQNYDLWLKTIENTNNIVHIDKVLYHHRKIQDIADMECENETCKFILEDALKRRNVSAEVFQGLTRNSYRVKYPIVNNPLVSIVIPFKDMPELLEMCIGSILTKSNYKNFEIIGISNNSEEEETFSLMETLEEKDTRVHFYEYNEPFNYSAVNNYAVNNFAKGEHILLLNNDIEIISPEWIESMLEFSQQDQIGAVGAKLYYPDNTIQHAGVIIGIGDSAAHAHRHFQKNSNGYHNRLNIIQNYSAVTAACLMVKASIYHEMNGLNEENLKVAFNDVDFCLRIMEKGYRNVYTPYAEAYHYESISRGYEDTSEKIQRFRNERGYLQERHAAIYKNGDPSYNKNLTFESEDFAPGKYVSCRNEKYLGKSFTEKIISSTTFSSKKHDFVCIFSHYDKNDIIDPYVVYYLTKLSIKYDIIFVSTALGLSHKELDKIAPYCMQSIVKENVGYDFGAWKTGLDFLGKGIESYNWLTLCNDSVYGPLHPISVITDHLENDSCDIFSLSENYERKRHFQSYFVSYHKKVFMNDLFKSFWNNFKIYDDKTTLINTCEIDFSHTLITSPLFRTETFAKRYNDTYVNVVQFFWDQAIKDGFPFIKIELFKDNPSKIDISNWESVLRAKTNYPRKLIRNHLKRFK